MEPQLFVGLISGTSVDGIDIAVTDFSTEKPTLIAFDCHPIDPRVVDDIHTLCADESLRPCDRETPGHLLAQTDLALGQLYSQAILSTLVKAGLSPDDIIAIGNHGQTVRHQPPEKNPQGKVINKGFSIQIGSTTAIAAATGIRSIGQFRQADMAAGGEGAPLAPIIHQRLVRLHHDPIAFLNLGGIANLTLIDQQRFICGYDTGPANTLMDAWIRKHRGLPYDDEGQWALSGRVIPSLLQELLTEPYFQLRFPKSTGRELFHLQWLEQRLSSQPNVPEAADVQATLLELTNTTILQALEQLPIKPRVLYGCGGGTRNSALMKNLEQKLNGIELSDTKSLGIHPDAVEACLFGWLAKLYVDQEKVDMSAITGSNETVLLGEE